MSIVRIGLAETKNFAEGYEAIFGTKTEKTAKAAAKSKTPAPAKKTGAKKAAAKPAKAKTKKAAPAAKPKTAKKKTTKKK